LKEAKTISVEIYGDSELVIKQLNGQYECRWGVAAMPGSRRSKENDE
jgi:ribonuclease HI